MRGFRAVFMVAVAGMLALGGCQRAQPKPPPPAAGYVVIREQAVPFVAELPGRTTPFAVSEVRPQVSGIIQKRLFVEGSIVNPGQALYQIDPAPYQAAYDNAAATLAAARSKASRYASLYKQNAIAAQAYDDAEAAYKQALAAVSAARINLNYTRIVAPIGGRIGASSVTQGALVTAQQATALAVISTLDPIYVDIDQSSAELTALRRDIAAGRLSRGGTAAVRLTLNDGSAYPLEGRLQFTDVTVDPSTGAVRLRALFPNPDGFLLPGLYVRATLTQGIVPRGILAPQHGVARNEKGDPIALVIGGDNVARLRTLRTGRTVGADWLVLDGLKPGDRMIVEGLQRVRPGMAVRPVAIAAGNGL